VAARGPHLFPQQPRREAPRSNPLSLLSLYTLGFENGGRSCRQLELMQPCHGVVAEEKRAAVLPSLFILLSTRTGLVLYEPKAPLLGRLAHTPIN